MALVRFDNVFLEFGDQPLLVGADFSVEPGERVCLIGRNGAGKTSMLKLITGEHQPDEGTVERQSFIGISLLEQTLPDHHDLSVQDYVAQGLKQLRELLGLFERLSAVELDKRGLKELEQLQQRLDAAGAWELDRRVATIISDLDLPTDRRLGELSGGWRRRVALAKALVAKPDLLLLDEPTNHLDLSTIQWLENQILGFRGTVIFVTHDRALMQKLSTRVLEIDRGKLRSWPGSYRRFLREKEKVLEAEAKEEALFDKKLAQEEIWIRQGLKARRTRNEGRVRALEAMRDERAKRPDKVQSAHMTIEEADASGRKVIRARNVRYSYGNEPLIEDFSIKVNRGERIGLVGNNGVGKSTLLKLLLGELRPQRGTVKLGTNLVIGYFDQLRRDLDPSLSVIDTVGEGRDYIKLFGKERHVVGYLKGFLFSPKRAKSPVASLSGGERNRLILAKLFTRPINLLILDEPTNDLDVETLEVLEQRLADYQGTLIVVSHDREFLDNVVTSIVVFEAGGSIQQYVGNYSDWLARGRTLAAGDSDESAVTGKSKDTGGRTRRKTKLSYLEQRELDSLPDKIEGLEGDVRRLEEIVSAPAFYGSDEGDIKRTLEELKISKNTLEQTLERWMELEELRQDLEAR